MIQQRDAVGLGIFDAGIRTYLPPRGIASHFTQILEELCRSEARPKTNLGDTFHDLADRIKRRGLVVVISDLFGDVDDTLMGLRHFRHRKHEVIVFHVLDPAELNFPFDQTARFRDMETQDEIVAVPDVVRARYLEAMSHLQEGYRRELRLAGIDYVLLDTSVPLEVALTSYLMTRRRSR